MTNEEAIKALSLMEHVESIVATYEPGEIRNDTTVRELKEACRVAITVLRAQQEPMKQDRSRWEGCHHCNNKCCCTCIHSTKDMNDEPCCACCSASEYKAGEYCPNCGRPLTEEAWAELERRINGGTID